MDTLLSTLWNHTVDVLGLDLGSADLGFGQMACRALLVFFSAVVMLKLGSQRSLGRSGAFDAILLIILGSVLSRAINGDAAFFPTLGVSMLLVILHNLLALAAFHFHPLSVFMKGRTTVLVRDGIIDRDALRQARITENDLLENIRLRSNLRSVERVREARLERNGTVSVVV